MGRQMVLVVTRTDAERTAVLAVMMMRQRARAEAMIAGHVDFRIAHEGAVLHIRHDFNHAPVTPGAMVRTGGSENHPVVAEADPELSSVVHHTEIVERDGNVTSYRITQHPVL